MGGKILCIFLLSILYVLFGGAICPNSVEVRWLRISIIILWPLYLALTIVSIPFMLIWEFSKPTEQTDKEIKDFIKELSEF